MTQTVLLVDAQSKWILNHSAWQRVAAQFDSTCVVHAAADEESVHTLDSVAASITSEEKCFLVTQNSAWKARAETLGWGCTDTSPGDVSAWLWRNKQLDAPPVTVTRTRSSLVNYADPPRKTEPKNPFCSLS